MSGFWRQVGRGGSHHANIIRSPVETIMAAVDIADRGRQFVGVGIIKRGHRDKVEGAAFRSVFPSAGGADAASFAKAIVQVWSGSSRRSPLIFPLRISSRDLAKAIRANKHEPGAGLGTDGAIASVGAFAEIDVGFEANGATVTASGIGLQRH